MNREETIAAIKVMQAYVDGAEIEVRSRNSSAWVRWTTPVWDWDRCNYRIKPKPREMWVVFDAKGIAFIQQDGSAEAARMDRMYPGDAPHTAVLMREVTE